MQKQSYNKLSKHVSVQTLSSKEIENVKKDWRIENNDSADVLHAIRDHSLKERTINLFKIWFGLWT